MKRLFNSVSLLLFFIGFSLQAQQYNTAKPWAYWWWPGSAVNETDIANNLKTYAEAGFGGMHIIPIYGVKGEEENFIPYMSPRWLEILDFTTKEAAKNGMGIDMSLGTGWPFGGSNVSKEDGAKKVEFSEKDAYTEFVTVNTGQKVKRAAPGGEGLVIDHFDSTAVANYLSLFGEAFDKKNYGVRAFYNDSYEVYGANWTNDFLAKFEKLRGYSLKEYLSVLTLSEAKTEKEKRIWADYHQTLHDLVLNEFTKTWTGFATQYGKISRNEAHGSPANILDLYALSDVPETEFFGSKPYEIPGYRQDPDYDPSRFGTPTSYVMKLASSPAHIKGKKLVSSETATWNANHFKGSLSQLKPLIDESFVSGVNHIFYHGLPYSPPSAAWPGWLFYASTNVNQNSHFFEQLPLLNRYIEVCQDKLQNSTPDNDVLVLLPFSDLWHSVGPKAKMHMVDVHNIYNGGIFSPKLLSLLDSLTAAGLSYDFISDDQLYDLNIVYEKQPYLRIKEGLAKYKSVIIPESEYIKTKTAARLKYFYENGVPVIFENQIPTKSFGFKDFVKNDERVQNSLSALKPVRNEELLTVLMNLGIKGEHIGKLGLSYLRKINAEGKTQYFITNLSSKEVAKTISLNSASKDFTVFNPKTEKSGFIQSKSGLGEIDLYLLPGESIFITEGKKVNNSWQWPKVKRVKEIEGKWQVDFTKGEPFLPKSYQTESLESWATETKTDAGYYDGYGRYSTEFDLITVPEGNAILDLGDVRESARVKINGVELGTAWFLPFQLEIPAGVLKERNSLEVIVRNTSANRIRLLDEQKVNWKKFYDINFVDITYEPFDATKWKPQASGLLGPVRIIY
ncbi:MAG: glycosyl hydrolase [Cytophagales bacterium]|nr:glycosyl hydrolase [Cytophagales bacterium]